MERKKEETTPCETVNTDVNLSDLKKARSNMYKRKWDAKKCKELGIKYFRSHYVKLVRNPDYKIPDKWKKLIEQILPLYLDYTVPNSEIHKKIGVSFSTYHVLVSTHYFLQRVGEEKEKYYNQNIELMKEAVKKYMSNLEDFRKDIYS